MKKKPHQIITTPKAVGVESLWLALIAITALAVRIVFSLQTADDPFRGLLFLDAKVYHLLASDIASEGFWGGDVFFRSPLFPTMLGMVYKLFGTEQAAAGLINAALGIGTAVLTYLTAMIHFDRRVARIAGLCAAVYPTLYFFEATVMPTSLEIFTFTAAIYCLSRYGRSRKSADLVIAGVVLGLAALARPTILTFLIVLPIWLRQIEIDKSLKSITRKSLSIVIPLALVILPVTIRNFMIEQDLVMISSQGGSNFYIGNNPQADGQTVVFPFGEAPLNKYEDHIWSASKFLAERSTHHEMSAAEVSSFWLGKGREFVFDDPGQALGLFFKKLYLLFAGEEIFNNSNPMSSREYSPLYALSIWNLGIKFPFGLLAPLVLIGSVFLLLDKNKRLLLLLFVYSQVITLSLFFVSARFRQPLIPVMLMIAVYACFRIWSEISMRNWKYATTAGVTLILLIIALNPPVELASKQNRSMYHALTGGALASQEKYPEAVEQLRQAIVIADDNATAFQLLGSLYVKSGQLEQALAVLHRAEELAPDAIQTLAVLARIHYDRGDFARALGYFEKVIDSGAEIERFHLFAARSAVEIGDRDKALQQLELARKENPSDPEIKLVEDRLKTTEQPGSQR